jgi:hypothetical protein
MIIQFIGSLRKKRVERLSNFHVPLRDFFFGSHLIFLRKMKIKKTFDFLQRSIKKN